MIQLALLLIGADAFRRRWWVPAVAGLAMVLLGFAIIADLADGLTLVATQIFGFVFLLQGLAGLVAITTRETLAGRLAAATKALLLLALGVLVIDSPLKNDGILAWLFALGFAVDGISRLATVVVVRFRRWGVAAVSSCLELLLAGLVLSGWPLPAHLNIPLCISLLLVLSGVNVLQFARALRGEHEEVALLAMSMFGARHWNENAPVLIGDDDPEDIATGPMRVLIWTPAGAANVQARRPIIDRYLGALDANGVISTGHAALEYLPDVYISHWPGEEIERNSAQFAQVLHAGAQNNITGLFQPSYEVESSLWCPANETVEFTRFHPRSLSAYWAGYRQRNTYNVTDRNCSIAVAGALDSALEGSLETRFPWLLLVGLLLNPVLWEAAYIRSRAHHLCWTPGLVLDYARALHRLIEPTARSWPLRVFESLRRLAPNQPPRGYAP